MTIAARALDAIRDLGSPDELRRETATLPSLGEPPPHNAHIHLPPNFSAFDNVEQAVSLAAGQGLAALGVSNYYDYQVYGEFVALAQPRGIFPLFGLEIVLMEPALREAGIKVNDPGNPGKFYLCGKGITAFDTMTPRAKGLLQTIRDGDTARMAAMAGRVNECFSIAGVALSLDADAIIDRVVRRHGCPRERVYLQERHLAQMFQEALFEAVPEDRRAAILSKAFGVEFSASPTDAVGIQGALRTHLMKAGRAAFVEEKFVSIDQARDLILELGGIPCYPTLADGTKPVCGFETPLPGLVANLRERGIHMAELIPIRNTPEVLAEYAKGLRAAGFPVTAGTEHNTLELIALQPACVGGEQIDPKLQAIFWEGACVAAAHQHLTLCGETGFVDRAGNLNDQYQNDNERIHAFAAYGRAVVERYRRAVS